MYDFLTESEAGRRILSHDTGSKSDLLVCMSQGWLLQGSLTYFDRCEIFSALGPLCWVEGTHPRAREITEFARFVFETNYEDKEAIYLYEICRAVSHHGSLAGDAKDI